MADISWELVQIKGLTAWANTYLDSGNQIKSLETDLHDGVKLCLLVEGLKDRIEELQRKKIGAWQRKPAHRMQKIENANCALRFLASDIKVKVTAGAEDVVGNQETGKANVKMILGLLWSTFRKTLGLEEHSSTSEEYAALLEWVKATTAGYGVEVRGMKDSWGDGLVFNALLHKAGIKSIDMSKLNPANGAANLTQAFSLAEEHFKLPQLLEIPDLLENRPDERSVAFYLNLMRHAMTEALEKSKTTNTLQDLQLKLQAEEELRRQQEEELQKARALNEELEMRLKLENLLHLEELGMLEEKIQALQALLDDEGLDAASRERLKLRLEEALRAREELEELKKKLKASNSNLLHELEEAEKRRLKMLAELEELRTRIAKQMEKGKRRGKAAVELEGELEAMRQQAFVQQRARLGLDVLKRNLQEHLEDLYKWREVTNPDDEVLTKQVFDLQDYLTSMKGKGFEAQLDQLNVSLQGENGNLKRMLKMKDDTMDLNDVFIRSGWAEVKDGAKIKDWTKLYFNLRGCKLTYHKADNTERSIGGALLDQAHIDAPASIDGKEFVVKIVLREPKDFTILLSANKDDANAWYGALNGEKLYARYLASLEKSKRRPDMRVVNLFRAAKLNSIFVDNHPVAAEELVAVAHSLKQHNTVDTVSLTNAQITDALVTELASALGHAKYSHIKLDENQIGNAGAKALVDAFQKNKSLKSVSLTNNKLAGADAVAGLAALPLNSLGLAHNSLGDAGAQAFAKGASSAESKITLVDLSNNGITDAGAAAIADLLRANKNISKLNLEGNQIGDAGAKAIASALEGAHMLMDVNLSNNKIGAAGAVALRNAAVDSAVQTISLGGNPLPGGAELSGLLGAGFQVGTLSLTKGSGKPAASAAK